MTNLTTTKNTHHKTLFHLKLKPDWNENSLKNNFFNETEELVPLNWLLVDWFLFIQCMRKWKSSIVSFPQLPAENQCPWPSQRAVWIRGVGHGSAVGGRQATGKHGRREHQSYELRGLWGLCSWPGGWVSWCVCVFVCVHVCVCVCVCESIHTECVCTCMHTCACTCIYTSICGMCTCQS